MAFTLRCRHHQRAGDGVSTNSTQTREWEAPEDAPVVTQYEMHGVEELGLLKMDFLGLRNLDVITDTQAMIQSTIDPAFDIDSVPLDDAETFELLARGDTIGVFQLESPPMRQLLRRMEPNSFEDVSAVLALYRPGPMSENMHNDYADRKNGRKPVDFFHEDAREVLDDTFGLMIYQESVMRVPSNSLATRLLRRTTFGKPAEEAARSDGGRAPKIRGRVRNNWLRNRPRQAVVRHY